MSSLWGQKCTNRVMVTPHTFVEDVHITGATYTEKNCGDYVHLRIENSFGKVYTICAFSPHHGVVSLPLNLRFKKGESVKFHVTGGGNETVDLSGYFTPNFCN